MIIHNNNKQIFEQLKSDCSKCSGLCCTALFFSKIDGFPENKAAGSPCSNLQKDYYCRIHNELAKRKMKGCIGYDCFGAGQHVTQTIYKSETWQTSPTLAKEIYNVFLIIFQLNQIRFFLSEAITILPAKALWSDLQHLITENEMICNSNPQSILSIDIGEYRNRVNPVLKQVCNIVKNCFPHNKKNCPTEFLGKRFKNLDMSGFDLSMQLLIAADFSSCNFNGTNFLGADTRDTNFSNADLRESIFLTQGQVNSAIGNRNTKLPMHLDYPVTWK